MKEFEPNLFWGTIFLFSDCIKPLCHNVVCTSKVDLLIDLFVNLESANLGYLNNSTEKKIKELIL